MTQSMVKISMRDENTLNCSFAIITKDTLSIILILKDCEYAIYNYNDLRTAKENCHYLLLKHYKNPSFAYTDFLKMIGKMCKKEKTTNTFLAAKKKTTE